MSGASSPGLVISGCVPVRRERLMPIAGEVFVTPGATVRATDVIARALLPGRALPLRLAATLGVPPRELEAHLCVKAGERVEQGAILAEARSLFGFSTTQATAPCAGVIEAISTVTGQLMLRALPRPIELHAFVPGIVTDVIPERGAVISAEVAQLQGIFGLGRETIGQLVALAVDSDTVVSAEHIRAEHRGMVVCCRGQIDQSGLRQLCEVGARGAIAGSAAGLDLLRLSGGRLNPAATGDEGLSLVLVLTEGFGALSMSARAAALLDQLVGHEVALSGTTQIRAGVQRPEVLAAMVAPLCDTARFSHSDSGLGPQSRVRVIRGPARGAVGVITAAPPHPTPFPSGVSSLVYVVVCENGASVVVPRPNVELLAD